MAPCDVTSKIRQSLPSDVVDAMVENWLDIPCRSMLFIALLVALVAALKPLVNVPLRLLPKSFIESMSIGFPLLNPSLGKGMSFK